MPAIYDQILLFGDSITQQSGDQERGFAFAPALQAAYIRRLDVVNRGFSGYNTVMALKILPKIVPPPKEAKIRLMTVFFGANDACDPATQNGQFVPLDEFKENIKKMVKNSAVQAHDTRIIVVTAPPVDEYQLWVADEARGRSQPSRTAERTKSYADAAREAGDELGAAVLDVWTLFMTKAGWEPGKPLPGSREIVQSSVLRDLLHDGLHLNPSGYRIIHDELLKLIAVTWPDQTPEQLPFVLPAWDDADQWKGYEAKRNDTLEQSGAGRAVL